MGCCRLGRAGLGGDPSAETAETQAQWGEVLAVLTERLQHKGSCKHQIPAGFPFLACFKVFGVRSQGEDPQGHSKIGVGCIHTFRIPSQRVVWHIPRTAAPFAMALSKRPKTQSRDRVPEAAEAGAKGAASPQTSLQHHPPQTSLQHHLLQHPASPWMPRGWFLPDTPSWLLPFPLNSFHFPKHSCEREVWAGLRGPAVSGRGESQAGGPAWLPGREEGCERGGGVFHQQIYFRWFPAVSVEAGKWGTLCSSLLSPSDAPVFLQSQGKAPQGGSSITQGPAARRDHTQGLEQMERVWWDIPVP